MAIHPNARSLTIEAVEEYLTIAEYCTSATKKEGGIYGYPATLLLFCVVEFMGNNLLEVKEPFRVLNRPPFNCDLTSAQTKHLERWYRNLLAHNAMIAPGTCLSPEPEGAPFGFSRNDEPTLIRVKPFFHLVREAWNRFDTNKIKNAEQPEFLLIQDPVDLSEASTAVSFTASGSNYIPASKVPGTK